LAEERSFEAPITLGVLLGVFTEIALNYFGLMSNTDAVLLDVSTIPAVPPTNKNDTLAVSFLFVDCDCTGIESASGTDAGCVGNSSSTAASLRTTTRMQARWLARMANSHIKASAARQNN
jgi:hypothetical protein